MIMTGHIAEAEGALTLLLQIMHQMAPSINDDTPDPECTLHYVPNILRYAKVKENSFNIHLVLVDYNVVTLVSVKNTIETFVEN